MKFNAFFGGGGALEGGGASGGWIELKATDVTLAAGNYTASHANGDTGSGFEHKLTIDDSASSYYCDRRECAFLYYDTGLSISDLRAKSVRTLSVLIEFNIAAGDDIVNDSTGYANFAAVITSSTTLSSGAFGGFAGVICTTGSSSTMVRPLSAVGRISSDNNLTGIGTFTQFSPGSGDDDTFNSIQFSATGLTGSSSNYGFTGLDALYGFKDGGTTFKNSLTEFNRLSDSLAASGTLVIGISFGQRVLSGTPPDKSLNFNLKYLLESTS